MADDPIELAGQFWSAWNARDIGRMELLSDPAVEFRPLRAQLEGKSYVGPAGLRAIAAEVDEDWDNLQVVVESAQARCDDIAQVTRLQGRGRVSGVDLDVAVGWHVALRGERIVYVRAYSDPKDAFRAAGIQ
jgi:ketosteroid isomerase-like protein